MRASAVVNCQSAFACLLLRLFLPCGDLLAQGLLVCDAAIEALGRKQAELGLSHVEPTAVLGPDLTVTLVANSPRHGHGLPEERQPVPESHLSRPI
jgi:hypothetical protein